MQDACLIIRAQWRSFGWSAKGLMILLVVTCLFLGNSSAWGSETSLHYGRFGKLTLYRNTPQPSHVVLFVSGDGGWNLGVIDMAQSLAGLDALVVGIDITHYLKELAQSQEKCSYPAADFESLSKFVQMKLGFESYRPPVLVGYSSGATMVYALLAQAPPNTFRGAISMGFCPDLQLNKPFCGGQSLRSEPAPKEHGYNFLPTKELQNPWIAFQGAMDQVCDAAKVEAYVKQVDNGEVVLLPKVGHGFSVQKNWLPQFREAFTRLVHDEPAAATHGAPVSGVSDLPLVEVPAKGSANDLLAVILTGDGGWASLDRDIGGVLAAKGVAVVGFNTLQYFWAAKSPDLAAKDLERVMRHYLERWHRQRVLLLGYSLGADVLPFMAGRLPEDLRKQVAAVALLGPGKTANFEFHLSDWLGGGTEGMPVAPEMARLQGLKVLCLYGEEEPDSLCRVLPPDNSQVKVVTFGGGHHFGGDYAKLAELIFTEANAR